MRTSVLLACLGLLSTSSLFALTEAEKAKRLESLSAEIKSLRLEMTSKPDLIPRLATLMAEKAKLIDSPDMLDRAIELWPGRLLLLQRSWLRLDQFTDMDKIAADLLRVPDAPHYLAKGEYDNRGRNLDEAHAMADILFLSRPEDPQAKLAKENCGKAINARSKELSEKKDTKEDPFASARAMQDGIDAHFKHQLWGLGVLSELQAKLKKEPQNWALQERAAQIHLGIEEWDPARKIYRELIDQGPKEHASRYQFALAEIDSRVAAIKAFEESKARLLEAMAKRAEINQKRARLQEEQARILAEAQKNIEEADRSMKQLKLDTELAAVPEPLLYDETKPAAFWAAKVKEEFVLYRQDQRARKFAVAAKRIGNVIQYQGYEDKKNGRPSGLIARFEKELAEAKKNAAKQAAEPAGESKD